jgi:hypothetical protein
MKAPTNNSVTQGKHGTYNAIDYSAYPDPNIYAPEDGKITFYQNSGNCGNNLHLTSGGNVHGFCHLERATVNVGDVVKKGQVIGIMGYTGYTEPAGPAGRHLHWVVRQGSTYIYPPTLVNESFNQGDVMNNEAGTEMYRTALHREPENGSVTGQWNGQTPAQALRAVRGTEWQAKDKLLRDAPKIIESMQTTINELTTRPTNAQYAAAQASLNDKVAELTALQAKLEEAQNKPAVIKEVPVVDPSIHPKLDKILNLLKVFPAIVGKLIKRNK